MERMEAYCCMCLLILLGRQVVSKDACEKNFEGNQCYKLSDKTCLTGNLNYNFTSFVLVSGFKDTHKELTFWENLKSVPKCWDLIRPVLCALYLPRCDYDSNRNTSLIQLPGKELCDVMKGPCKIIDELNLWPAYLKCNHSYYCYERMADLKFASTSTCAHPLIKTNNSRSWYPGFEGCTFGCANPWFTDEDHHKVHFTILVLGLGCIACNFFVLLTFICNWKRMSVFPDIIVLYINVCYMFASFGWMAQFVPSARNSIVCRSDGTPKKAEPQFKSDESVSCVAIFIIIYFFTLASIAWLVVLSYTWQIAFETSRNQVKKKKAYFHLGVWVISFVLTILSLAFTEVDGDTVSGICFIGLENFSSRIMFVLSPMVIACIAGLTFLIRGLVVLTNMRSQSPDFLSKQRHSKLKSSIIRIGIFACLMFLLGVTVLGLHVHVFVQSNNWRESMKSYIICRSNITGKHRSISECSFENKPNTLITQLSAFCFFGFGVLMSSWLWKMATFKSWKHCCMRKLCSRRLHSVDCQKLAGHSEHDRQVAIVGSETEDLIGMDFDLNSMSSFEVSSLSSMLTPNRRFSDSDVSSFGTTHTWSTKKQRFELKQSFVNNNPGSSLSSSEWSASESQKSHFSIDTSLLQQFQTITTSYNGSYANCQPNRKCFILERHILNNDLSVCSFNGNFPEQIDIHESVSSIELKELPCEVLKLEQFFDLKSFRTTTDDLYNNIEDSVVCIDDLLNENQKLMDLVFDCELSDSTSDDCETLDSSNSNYTLASSDTAVLSIRLDENYCPIDLSLESLNREPVGTYERDHSSNDIFKSDLQKTISSRNLNILAYHECNMDDFPLPLIASPFYIQEQFWLPSDCQHFYRDESERFFVVSAEEWKMNIVDGEFRRYSREDGILDNVKVFGDKDEPGYEDMSKLQIQQDLNDGDESGNVSDPGTSFKVDAKSVSLKRKKRFQTLIKDCNILNN